MRNLYACILPRSPFHKICFCSRIASLHFHCTHHCANGPSSLRVMGVLKFPPHTHFSAVCKKGSCLRFTLVSRIVSSAAIFWYRTMSIRYSLSDVVSHVGKQAHSSHPFASYLVLPISISSSYYLLSPTSNMPIGYLLAVFNLTFLPASLTDVDLPSI